MLSDHHLQEQKTFATRWEGLLIPQWKCSAYWHQCLNTVVCCSEQQVTPLRHWGSILNNPHTPSESVTHECPPVTLVFRAAGMEQVASNCESTEINGLYTRMHINSLSLNNFPAYIFCNCTNAHQKTKQKIKKNNQVLAQNKQNKNPSSLLNQCKHQMVSEVIGHWFTFTEKKAARLQPICFNLLPEPLTLQISWQKKTWLCLSQFSSVGIFT